MKHQQTVYLQEIGITRWIVRKPALFNRESHDELVDLSRFDLLIICSDKDFNHPLVTNILKAFKFTADQVCHCSLTEFENYQGQLPEYIWSTVGNIDPVFGHKFMRSVSIPELDSNPKEKRTLWEQFCAFNKQ